MIKLKLKKIATKLYYKLTYWRDDPRLPYLLVEFIDWIRYEILWDLVDPYEGY